MNTNTKIHSSLQWMSATAFVVMAMTGLVACGGAWETNPAKDYAELADAVPPGETVPLTESYIDSGVFQIETDRNLHFVQGAETTYYVRPRLLMSGVDYELTAQDLPEGAKFARATEPELAGLYKLTWAPRAGLLGDQERDRPYKFYIQLNVKSADPRAAKVLKSIGHPREFELLVVRTNEQPLVEKVEFVADEVQEGSNLAFKAIVKDLGAYEGRPPVLYAVEERKATSESVRVSAAGFVKFDRNGEPRSLGGGRYEFSGRLETAGMILPGTSASVPARFMFIIQSASGLPSPEQVVEVKVLRKAKASAPAPRPSTPTSGGRP